MVQILRSGRHNFSASDPTVSSRGQQARRLDRLAVRVRDQLGAVEAQLARGGEICVPTQPPISSSDDSGINRLIGCPQADEIALAFSS